MSVVDPTGLFGEQPEAFGGGCATPNLFQTDCRSPFSSSSGSLSATPVEVRNDGEVNGIHLTVYPCDDGLRGWDDERKQVVAAAVQDLQTKGVLSTFNGVEIRNIPFGDPPNNTTQTTGIAETLSSDLIEWYSDGFATGVLTKQLVVHEFGHILQYMNGDIEDQAQSITRITSSASSFWPAVSMEDVVWLPLAGAIATSDYIQGSYARCGQDALCQLRERIADMFLIWVYSPDSFNPSVDAGDFAKYRTFTEGEAYTMSSIINGQAVVDIYQADGFDAWTR